MYRIFMPSEYQIWHIYEPCVHRLFEVCVHSGVFWALNAMKAWVKSLSSSGLLGVTQFIAGECVCMKGTRGQSISI